MGLFDHSPANINTAPIGHIIYCQTGSISDCWISSATKDIRTRFWASFHHHGPQCDQHVQIIHAFFPLTALPDARRLLFALCSEDDDNSLGGDDNILLGEQTSSSSNDDFVFLGIIFEWWMVSRIRPRLLHNSLSFTQLIPSSLCQTTTSSSNIFITTTNLLLQHHWWRDLRESRP